MAEPATRPSPRPRAAIVGTGSYVPERILTNADLEEMVDTSDEWIQARTGMKERRIAAADESTSDMAAKAARRALEDAGVSASDVEFILVATATPDMLFPNTASLVQHLIKADRAACMDSEAPAPIGRWPFSFLSCQSVQPTTSSIFRTLSGPISRKSKTRRQHRWMIFRLTNTSRLKRRRRLGGRVVSKCRRGRTP